MARDDIDSSKVAVIGFSTAVVVFVIIVAAQALYYHMASTEKELKQGSEAPPELRQLESQQYGQLHTYRWVDAKKTMVAIPIGRAIDLLAQESKEAGL